ncbi:MAG: SDR family NAD(P)-dependent oxidoreductase, partial [Anaerolineae bacterium]|nr:SDR family NAD(P)-dependent oxidoreductase [Anaerolineae bacterium]
PYLVDHQVQRRVVLPAAAYLEIALAAARDALGDGLHQLRDVTLHEALFLSADEATVMQVALSPQMTFEIYSQQSDSWVLHVSGTVFTDREGQTPDFEVDVVMTAQTQLEQPDSRVDGSVHYGLMAQRALHYGPAFQGINAFTLDGDEGAARVTLPDHANRYQLHPALLDAAFQLLLEKLPDTNQDTYLPVELDMLAFYSQPEQAHELYALAQWTAITDSNLTGDVRLVDETGRILAAVYGLRMKRVTRESTLLHEGVYQVAWTPAEIDPAAQAETDGSWLVFADTQGVGTALVEHLNDVGSRTAVVFAGDAFAEAVDSWTVNPASEADFDALLSALDADFIGSCRGVTFLWPLDADTDQLPDAAYSGVISALYLSRMLSRAGLSLPVWLITCGAQAVDGPVAAPAQSSLWGLGAVMSNEYADLQPVRIDLDPTQIDIQALMCELTLAGVEDQIAYRGSQRYVARLESFAVDEAADESAVTLVSPEEQPFRAEVTVPGVLDNLRLGAMSRLNPVEGEVEIEVHATGLNFMNVMAALGVLPGYDDGIGPLGIECAGRIVQVGDGVDEWQVGDEVVAIAFNSLATHAVTDAHLVARKPEHLSFAEAATIPIVFLTAYYALHDLARMQRGERVLIHSGAGGVGLAAIQLVQMAGAEAWATVGNDEKREYLHQLGVQHVMNSHSLAFADDVLTATDGEGVDIVLNSLAGAAIGRGLAILRPYGRFVEIGKRDIYGNTPMGLQPFSRNLSYFAVDLDKMARERPDKVGVMLREIMALVENGDLQPLPLQTFPAAQVADAFRFMAQGKHIGKIVILPREGESPVHIPAGAKVRADGSYLITGGLGGLGLTVAHWLASQGAGQIVLVGRRAPDAFAAEHIEAMRAAGADVRTVQADVTDADSVAQLMQAIQQDMLPLRGVFHAAGLLDDGLMEQLDAPRFHKVMSPKVEGAWHLHQMTLDAELDWFVLFSSVSALLGIPGQANYAAGNAFMDGLAHYRRTMELPALSVNWGPWADIGLAAAQANRGVRLTTRGLGSIAPQDGIRALETLLAQATAQVTVMTFDANQWAQVYPTANQSSLLKEMIGEIEQAPEAAATKSSESIRDRLVAVESDAARMSLLQDHIREQVGAVLGLATPRVDVNKPLRNQGLDSLMTLEMRNRLEASLGLKLSATLVFNYPSVVALTKYLGEKLDLVKTATVAATAAPEPVQEQIDDFEELSQEEVEAMLAEELASLDDLLKGE